MKLNRNHVFLIGVGIIILYIFINRFYFILRSDFAKGEVISIVDLNAQGKYTGPVSSTIVQFSVNNNNVTFTGDVGLGYAVGDKVDVIYLKSKVTKAYIYTLKGFWIPGALWVGLFPLMVLIAAVYSFIEPTAIIQVDFNNLFRIKKHKKSKDLIKFDA